MQEVGVAKSPFLNSTGTLISGENTLARGTDVVSSINEKLSCLGIHVVKPVNENSAARQSSSSYASYSDEHTERYDGYRIFA
jgi:hypothetical protein